MAYKGKPIKILGTRKGRVIIKLGTGEVITVRLNELS